MEIRLDSFERVDADGCVIDTPGDGTDRYNLLRLGEEAHRELRPSLPRDYVDFVEVLLAEGTGITHLVDGDRVRALAVWRVFTTTYCGIRFEIDDLVTAETQRSRGYGRTLLAHLEKRAAAVGCPTLTLNSATHRGDAHRFYRREGYEAIGLHFSKKLTNAESETAPD